MRNNICYERICRFGKQVVVMVGGVTVIFMSDSSLVCIVLWLSLERDYLSMQRDHWKVQMSPEL